MDWGVTQGHTSQLKEPPMAPVEQLEEQNKKLDYNPRCKINVPESKLTQIF